MELDQDNLGVVFVTTSSQAEAEAIAVALLEAKLAVCISILPVKSMYRWQGAIERAEEWKLWIKTDLEHFPKLQTLIETLHSYEVPEVIALPIVQGSKLYLDWLRSSLIS